MAERITMLEYFSEDEQPLKVDKKEELAVKGLQDALLSNENFKSEAVVKKSKSTHKHRRRSKTEPSIKSKEEPKKEKSAKDGEKDKPRRQSISRSSKVTKNLSEKKLQKLEELRKLVKDEQLEVREFLEAVYDNKEETKNNLLQFHTEQNQKKLLDRENDFLLWFLYARKWNVGAALARLKEFMPWRRSLGYISFDRVKNELYSGKIQLLHYREDNYETTKTKIVRDNNKRQIIYIKPRLHTPASEEHDVILAILYLMERVLKSKKTRKHGITFLVNTRGAGLSNVDRKLAQNLTNALQNKVPLRLSSILILEPPTFFRSVIWPIMKLFLKQKLIDRVLLLRSIEQLIPFVKQKFWPEELGGPNCWDFKDWLKGIAAHGGQQYAGNWSTSLQQVSKQPTLASNDPFEL